MVIFGEEMGRGLLEKQLEREGKQVEGAAFHIF